MIDSQIFLIAEGITRDKETNKISIFNLIDDIVCESLPFLVPKFTFLSIFNRSKEDPKTFDLNLKITNNEKLIANANIPVDFSDQLKSRIIINFSSVVIREPGILKYTIFNGEIEIKSYEITVAVREKVEDIKSG